MEWVSLIPPFIDMRHGHAHTADVEIRVLGDLTTDGGRLSPKERSLLAVLVLRSGNVVTPPELADGEWGDPRREAFGDTVIDTIAERAPNIRDLIIGRQVLTPLDIERTFGLTEGNIFQGELTLEQLFFNRPVPGYARFRTPIRDLWLCGSSTHPGGGIMGANGRIAALEVLRSRGRKAA